MINRNYETKPRFFNVIKEPIIGKNCGLVNTLLDCADQIRIGDNVFFGHDVKILTSDHDYTVFGIERMKKVRTAPVIIDDGVWIATGVIICKGVTIGTNAVVCAGSVVLKDIPLGEMWGGNPAKFIKKIWDLWN